MTTKQPYITIQISDKSGEVVRKVGSRRRRRIYHFLQAEKFKDCVFELCVRYSGDYKNEGEYKTKKDLIHALKAFTEKDLIDDFCV